MRYGCQCEWFLACAQMLMHAIAHGGCTNTVRESALNVDSCNNNNNNNKSCGAPGSRTCISSVPARRSTNWATTPPHLVIYLFTTSVCLSRSLSVEFGDWTFSVWQAAGGKHTTWGWTHAPSSDSPFSLLELLNRWRLDLHLPSPYWSCWTGDVSSCIFLLLTGVAEQVTSRFASAFSLLELLNMWRLDSHLPSPYWSW